MAEPLTPEAVDDTPVEPTNPKKRKRNSTDDAEIPPDLVKHLKRVVLSLTKPSYLLGVGSTKPRSEHRERLTKLLQKMVKQQNWVEASGVLSVLLKAGRNDRSPENNRFKYSVFLEILERLGGKCSSSNSVMDVYDVWMNRNRSRIAIGHSVEYRYAVELECALFLLKEGNLEEAYNRILSLKQIKELGNSPMLIMIFGLINMQLWYSNLPEEMQWRESDQYYTARQPNEIGPYSEVEYAANTHKTGTASECGSDTSVMNDKVLSISADSVLHREISVGLDDIKIENSQQNIETPNFYAESAENSENDTKGMGYSPIFAALEGMESLLLPIRLPDSTNTKDFMNIFNDHFRNAVKFLREALHSTPPVLVALHPLIQLLLIGGEVKEALNELDYCCNYNIVQPMRLRAGILERFDRSNSALLCTCYEAILKNDPTCCDSLEKLVRLHQNDEYNSKSLLETIGLHLDATYADDNTWREFALCFLKLSQYEEDCLSGCLNANEGGHKEHYSDWFSKTPQMFIEGKLGESWRLRCRWWRTRHFSHSMLASEIAAGDLQLLTYKAACVAHMYGSEFYYVEQAYACLKKREERDLLKFLKTHMQRSVQIHLNGEQRTG